MVVVLHAILRAGGAYVPIDPEYPDERVDLMLEDLAGPLLLTQRRLAPRFTDAAATVVLIDDLAEGGVEGVDASDLPRATADDLAYVIYTSGSTGRPKGVMITHGAIANRMYWLQEYFGLTPADRILQKTPFSFDPSTWQFFWPLMVGAEIVVAEPGGHRDSAYLARAIIEHGITTIHFVPTMLQLFLEDPRAADCTSLERVICSGEVLSKTLQDRFFETLGARLYNLFGPSEAIGVAAWTCDAHSDLPFVPVGRAVANTQLHILDDDLRPLPVGSVGELYIGGAQVARGYLGRPELTAEHFIDHPLGSGGRLYRSGDLARYLPDGDIEFVGRTDLQVKIRGNRVELGEIEATLESFHDIHGSAVVALERAAGDIELVAYVSHPDGDRLRLDALRARLAERLPDYMLPSTIIVLEHFPLTEHGKLDRAALPPPVRVRPALDRPYVAPRTALQRDIAERWRQILDLDRVGIHDRFFELGGTSLQAARFIIGMQAALGESIYVVTLFDAPSVAEYAAFLERTYPSAVARHVGVQHDAAAEAVAMSKPSERPRAAGGSRGMLSRQRARRMAGRGRPGGGEVHPSGKGLSGG
jgi:amino acid adenylation domain-containing protein